MMIDSIIFDLDGTLWDSTQTSADIWNQILKKHNEVQVEITAQRLKQLFGKPLSEIGIALFQDFSRERALELIQECCREQCQYIAESGGILYPDLETTLEELAKQYRLFIVSNCEDGYIESFFAAHKLNKYFSDYECPGRTGVYKAENIKLVVERNYLQNPIYVGDTMGDQTAAKVAGVPFIYASYGFGQVNEYDGKIDAFHDLLHIKDLIE